jgi:hypothetical protein
MPMMHFVHAIAIAAWSKSRSFGKAAKARNLLERMKDLYEAGKLSAGPNTHCYTAVINSCAYCENDSLEKRDALKIALATYKELERTPEYGGANNVAYATMLTALRNLLPPSDERDAAAESIFKRCCATGQVDQLVVRRLSSMLNTQKLKHILSDSLVTSSGEVDTRQIPEEWRRNLKP